MRVASCVEASQRGEQRRIEQKIYLDDFDDIGYSDEVVRELDMREVSLVLVDGVDVIGEESRAVGENSFSNPHSNFLVESILLHRVHRRQSRESSTPAARTDDLDDASVHRSLNADEMGKLTAIFSICPAAPTKSSNLAR